MLEQPRYFSKSLRKLHYGDSSVFESETERFFEPFCGSSATLSMLKQRLQVDAYRSLQHEYKDIDINHDIDVVRAVLERAATSATANWRSAQAAATQLKAQIEAAFPEARTMISPLAWNRQFVVLESSALNTRLDLTWNAGAWRISWALFDPCSLSSLAQKIGVSL